MERYIALLKAVNLGGGTMVPMATLRDLAVELGLSDVRTLLQSGNLLFRSDRLDAAGLEAELEAVLEKTFGRPAGVFVRTAAQWAAVIAANPFADAARDDPGRLLVYALKTAPSRDQVAALRAAIVGRERIEAVGRELFAVYPDGAGESKLTVTLIARHLGGPTSGRNWNTTLKLAAAVS